MEVTPRTARPRVVLDGAAFSTLLPAPDGKTLAVRCLIAPENAPVSDRLLVIDFQGEVTADLELLKQ